MSGATRPLTWIVAAIAAFALVKAFQPQAEPLPERLNPSAHAEQEQPAPTEAGAISQEAFAGRWPFVTRKAVVHCLSPRDKRMLVVTLGSETFALNGTARSHGYPDLGAHWLDDQTNPGTKVSVADVIQHGLALCD